MASNAARCIVPTSPKVRLIVRTGRMHRALAGRTSETRPKVAEYNVGGSVRK